MKKSQIRILAVCGSVVLGLTLFQNCGQVNFAPTQDPLAQSSGDPDTVPVEPPQPPPTNVVCDPFNQANIIDPKFGIEGKLHSAGSRLDTGLCDNPTQCTSRDYVKLGMKIDAVLFLSQIFVPTRNFSEGFSADGVNALQDANNQDLVEWFALDLMSQFVLDTNDDEGDYQFAIISDDGHTLDIENAEFLKDEGEHAPRLKCSATSVNFKKTDKRPFRLTYFQGPRTQISLVMLWRKVDSTTDLNDCGTSDGYLNDQNNLPQALSQKGWKVMKPGNFLLAAGKNLCAP